MQWKNIVFGVLALLPTAFVAGHAFADQVRAEVIALEGMPLPGSGGMPVHLLFATTVNGLGQVGFAGHLTTGTTTNSSFAFVNNQVVYRSDLIPGAYGIHGQIGVSNAGDFILHGAQSAAVTYTNRGVIMRSGEPAPGIPGKFATYSTRAFMADDATAFWLAGLSNSPGGESVTQAFYKAVPNGASYATAVPFLRGGDFVPGAGADPGGTLTVIGIGNGNISPNGLHYANAVTLVGSAVYNSAVVYDGRIVVRHDDPIGTGRWRGFRQFDIDNTGNLLIYGRDNSPADEIITYNNQVIAREGQFVDGEQLGERVIGAALNNHNQVLHLWQLMDSGCGLFFGDASNLSASKLLLEIGDTIDTTGDGVNDFTVVDFLTSSVNVPFKLADNGAVYIDLSVIPIAGGEPRDAIVKILVPEPACIGIPAATFLLVRLPRRRRHQITADCAQMQLDFTIP